VRQVLLEVAADNDAASIFTPGTDLRRSVCGGLLPPSNTDAVVMQLDLKHA
jgi:hypothetical protein